MTEYTDIVGHPNESSSEHKERSNPLNSRTKTAKWIRSTIHTGIQKSSLKGTEVVAIVENAVREVEGGDQSE